MTDLKKEKILSAPIKPIKLKFQNIKENINENQDAHEARSTKFSPNFLHDSLSKLEASLEETLINKGTFSHEMFELCTQLLEIVKKELESTTMIKKKFRIIKSAKKIKKPIQDKNQSFEEQNPTNIMPLSCIVQPISINNFQKNLSQLKAVSVTNQSGSSIFKGKIAIKRNLEQKNNEKQPKQLKIGDISDENNRQLSGSNVVAHSFANQQVEIKEVTEEDIVKKLKMKIRKLTRQLKEKNTQLAELNANINEISGSTYKLTAYVDILTAKNQEMALLLSEKEEQIIKNTQKSQERQSHQIIQKVQYLFDLHFQLKVLDPIPTPTQQIPQKQSIPQPQQKSEQPSSSRCPKTSTYSQVILLEQIAHLQLIIVTQNQEIDKLQQICSKIS